MANFLWYVVIFVVSYLIGSINLSIVLCKKIKGQDIRDLGSGNAGTTNTLRILGKGPAALTLLFDILKGVICVIIARLLSITGWILDPRMLVQIAAIGAILGHDFPIYYQFKGGKGVATSLGIIFAIDYRIGAVCLVFGILIIVFTRYVSLASITCAVLFVIMVLFIKTTYMGFFSALIIAGLLIYKHRSNIARLLKGTENKIGQKKQ